MKKINVFITCLIMSLLPSLASNGKITPTIYKNADKVKLNHWVDSVYNTLSMQERVGQLFIMVFPGSNTPTNRKNIEATVRNTKIGGLLFSKSNVVDHTTLVNTAQSVSKVPLMVTLDGEWGLSMRIAKTTLFPHNMMLGAIQNDSLLYQYGLEVARQCKLMGIHVNFAPDIDVNSNPANPVIGNRSFGENPQKVAKKGIMYAKGLEAGNVMSVSKHFPGHGDTSTDSHHTLPLISHNIDRLNSVEIYPFKEYINAGLSSVMVGHLNIPALDNTNQPSSLSKKIVTDLLQDQLNFSGLIFTDGLQMKGVSNEKDHCVRALLAGNDVLLAPVKLTEEYNSVVKAVENGTIAQSMLEEKCKKILAYKYILGVNNQTKDIEGLETAINSPHAEWLNRQLNKNAMTLLKVDDNLVPLKQLDKQKIAVVSVGGTLNNSFSDLLNKYADVVRYSALNNAELLKLKTTLSPYSTIIFSIHSTKSDADKAIETIGNGKNVILSFFTTPYEIASYASSVKRSKVVIAAYENTKLAQEYAAQAIFGGNEVTGKLPVTIKGLFEEGFGIDRSKTRLGYGIPEDVGIQSQKLNEIRAIAEEGITEKAYPGCQILIAKDGVVIFEESFGSFEYNGNRIVTNDDIYDLASMTKATATVPALMKLYDDKKISVNDRLSKYVPALQNTNKATITVRDALYHQSRIPAFLPYYMGVIDEDSYAGGLFSAKKEAPFTAQIGSRSWARTDYKYKSNMVSKKEQEGYQPISDRIYVSDSYKDYLLKAIATSPLSKRKSYRYSCLNFMLLKEMIEERAKTDLDTYVQDNFFHRLGSVTTTYNPLNRFEKGRIVPTEQDDFLRKGLVQGYVHDEGAALMGGISGNAGLFSNANDLAKLYQMLLNGGKYGGEEFLSEKTCHFFTSAKSTLSRRGLGFDKPQASTSKSSPTSLSTPLSTYGHTGFTGTAFWIDPDNNLIYIFLSNRVYPNRSHNQLSKLNIRSRIQETIYNAIKL